METVAEIAHLKKSFGGNQVLKDINFKIEKGKNLVVFGRSGSGKSVLIKCLIGLIEPDDGAVVLFDKNVLDLEALKNVGLENAIDKMPSELSGGMRKRVGLARALILKPEIILYDEPTTGMDPITSEEISKLILNVQKKYNTASIIITHDVECARITANRMIILREGTSDAEGTLQELSESKDEWIRSFFKHH